MAATMTTGITFALSAAAVTTNTTGTYTRFDLPTGWYEFGYDGTIESTTIQLKFKNSSGDDAKSVPGAALTSSLPSKEVRCVNGQLYTYTTSGGTTFTFIPRLTRVGF